MGTRSTIIIEGVTDAKVYKHWDGYPSVMLPWLESFNTWFTAARGDDPSYKFAQLLRDSARYPETYHLDASTVTGWAVVGFDQDMGGDFEYTLKRDGTVECRGRNGQVLSHPQGESPNPIIEHPMTGIDTVGQIYTVLLGYPEDGEAGERADVYVAIARRDYTTPIEKAARKVFADDDTHGSCTMSSDMIVLAVMPGVVDFATESPAQRHNHADEHDETIDDEGEEL